MEHDATTVSSYSSVRRLVVVAAALLLTQSWPSAWAMGAENQCDPPGVWQTGQALDETASKASGANVSLIEPTRSGKLQECVDRCCKRDDCSVATVKVQDKGTVLCALFNCNPPEKCIFKKSARLLSLDRTATAFLRRVVAGWPKYSNVEVHTGNLTSTNATSSSTSTSSPTPDTTLPFVVEVTTANVTTPAFGDKSTTTVASAPKLNTEDSDANSPAATTESVTAASGLNASTTSTTRAPLGLSGILDLLNHVAESRTHSELHEESASSTDSASHVSGASLSVTSSTTESSPRSSSTTPASDDMSPPAYSDMPVASTSTEGTTSTTTTVSSALEASMKKILPTNTFDGDAWWSRLSAPMKASNPSTNATSVTTQSANTTEKSTDTEAKTNDLRGPIQIFAPTTLNVDLTASKASPSISLVIGLCLGLLLIFVVMGLIGRRILDVWQRRHYSKMDFLVDGMYHVT